MVFIVAKRGCPRRIEAMVLSAVGRDAFGESRWHVLALAWHLQALTSTTQRLKAARARLAVDPFHYLL